MPTGAVVVFGSANIDLVVRSARVPGPGETVIGRTLTQTPGGKGANQAVAAARMGATTRFVGRVGSDAFGDALLASLADNSVDTSGITVTPAATTTGVALIVVDDSADNRIIVVPGANATLDSDDLGGLESALDGAAVLMLQLEIPLAAAIAAARLGRERGVIVILDPAPVPSDGLPDELVRCSSILTPNEHEAARLVGVPLEDLDAVARAADELRSRGAETVIVTLGQRGAYWAGPSGTGLCPAPTVDAVDTVGAGDAFNGALAAALAQGDELAEGITLGVAAGALAATRPGAQAAIPTRDEVRALLGA